MRGLLVFIVWSLVEISLFVTVGSWIGLLGTLLVVVGSGMAGVAVLRWQGTHLGQALKSNVVAMRDPLSPLAHSGLLGLAGALLILPGFLTDVVGLVLLLPWVRQAIIGNVATRLRAAVFDRAVGALHPRHEAEVIDAEVVEVKPDGPRPPSGWTKP